MDVSLRYFRQCAQVGMMITVFGSPLAMAQPVPINAADVVYVGHSLTNENITQMVSELAASKGMRYSHAVQSLPGHSLAANWGKCRESTFVGDFPPTAFACDAIDAGSVSGPYSVLIATDTSNSIAASRQYNEPHVYFERLMEQMLSRNPTARNFFYTSWEDLGYAGHDEDWTIEVISELAIYELIAADAEALSRQRGRNGDVQVLPVNMALRRLILAIEAGSVPGLTTRYELFADAIHPNATGNYFVACVIYSALFNQSPEGAATLLRNQYGTVTVNLPGPQALQLQRIAWQTVSEYMGAAAARPSPPIALTAQ